MTKIELRRLLKNRWYWISILVGMIIMSLHLIMIVLPDAINVWNNAYSDKILMASQLPNVFSHYSEISGHVYDTIFHILLPLLICVPYAGTFFTDRESEYSMQILTRVKKSDYYKSKLIVQFFAAGTITVIPMIFSFMSNLALLPSVIPESGSCIYPIYEKVVFSEIFYSNPYLYVFIWLIYQFIVYGIVGCIGFIFFDMLSNSFMVIITPFILGFTESVIGNATGLLSVEKCFITYNLKYDSVVTFVVIMLGIVLLILGKYVHKIKEGDVI